MERARDRKSFTRITLLVWQPLIRIFNFHLALSSPLPDDNWQGHTGFIHEVVFEKYLKQHANPSGVEYYLCGPPMMIKACTRMLEKLGVSQSRIAFDEF